MVRSSLGWARGKRGDNKVEVGRVHVADWATTLWPAPRSHRATLTRRARRSPSASDDSKAALMHALAMATTG